MLKIFKTLPLVFIICSPVFSQNNGDKISPTLEVLKSISNQIASDNYQSKLFFGLDRKSKDEGNSRIEFVGYITNDSQVVLERLVSQGKRQFLEEYYFSKTLIVRKIGSMIIKNLFKMVLN